MEVTVHSTSRDLLEAAASDLPEGFTGQPLVRLPGHAQSYFELGLQIASIPAGVASGLLANLIWRAFTKAAAPVRASVQIRSHGREVTFDFEGVDRRTLEKLVGDALDHVHSD